MLMPPPPHATQVCSQEYLDRLLAVGHERGYCVLEAVGMCFLAEDMDGWTQEYRTFCIELVRALLAYNILGDQLYLPFAMDPNAFRYLTWKFSQGVGGNSNGIRNGYKKRGRSSQFVNIASTSTQTRLLQFMVLKNLLSVTPAYFGSAQIARWHMGTNVASKAGGDPTRASMRVPQRRHASACA